MSRVDLMTERRTAQLVAAATDRCLYFDVMGILRHRSGGSRESDLAVHRRDAEIVSDLIKLGQLRRDETGAVVHTELVRDIDQVLDVEAGPAAITTIKERP